MYPTIKIFCSSFRLHTQCSVLECLSFSSVFALVRLLALVIIIMIAKQRDGTFIGHIFWVV